jgi:hypothetical protein
MKSRFLFGAAMLVAVATGSVGTTGIASAAPSPTPMAYTCAGGDLATGTFVSIPSGTYSNLRVTGACQPALGAVINVVGNVEVAADAALDAQSYASTITVGRNVTAGSGALLGLGCLPNPPDHTTGHPCVVDPSTASSSIKVDGNVIARNANTVLMNGITVTRNVTLVGGGGAIPWSIKGNTIGGNLIVSDMTPNWLGVIRNNIGGSAILTNVNITDGLPPNNDPMPTIFVASNQVGQNLECWGLGPYVAGGFPGEVNVVGGKRIGQCDNLADITPSS